MNFDVNTLSTLMQFMGSAKPTENAKPQEPPAAAQDKPMSRSVFAMQNGLGERVDFNDSRQKSESTKQAAPNMQLSSLLEMMSGNKSGKQGDMSAMLPLLMGLMGGRGGQGGNDMSAMLPMLMKLMGGQNSQQKPAPETNKKEEPKSETKPKEQTKDDKPQQAQIKKDKYDPISFAGYAMISALNKLYVSQFKARR